MNNGSAKNNGRKSRVVPAPKVTPDGIDYAALRRKHPGQFRYRPVKGLQSVPRHPKAV